MSTTKRWILSSLVSFATGFAIVFLGEIDNITFESFKDGSIVGFLFLAARAGVKAVLEAYLAWRAGKL